MAVFARFAYDVQMEPKSLDHLTDVLANAKELVRWIAREQDGLEIRADNAVRVPGILLDLAIEHHVGIVGLVDGRVYGSSFALLRAQFEAYVRALWLRYCATVPQLEAFIEKDALPPKLSFGDMIAAIEQQPAFATKVLSGIKAAAWTPMNGYTHGGMHQIARRAKDGSIEPNYDPDEVVEVLKAAGTFALMALQQIAVLADASELIEEVREKLANGTPAAT